MCGQGAEFEVEFMTGDGRTVGVLTLGASEIRKLDGSEILHARRVSAQEDGQGPPARTPFPWVAGGRVARHPVGTSFRGRGAKPTVPGGLIMKDVDSESMRAAAGRTPRLALENRAAFPCVHCLERLADSRSPPA